jgi:hypothetical protein
VREKRDERDFLDDVADLEHDLALGDGAHDARLRVGALGLLLGALRGRRSGLAGGRCGARRP